MTSPAPPPETTTAASAVVRMLQTARHVTARIRSGAGHWHGLPVVAAVRRGVGVVTRTGWACALLLALCIVGGARLGWQEAWAGAAVLGVVVATAWLWLLPRGGHAVTHELFERRVTVGDNAIVHLTVHNPAGRILLPARMEMPVGTANAVFAVPTLRPGADHERGFILPTARRSVVTVGPVVSVRSDPVGLLRSEHNHTEPQLVHIHPRIIRLGVTLRGMMRDVEGAVTQELSSSDVSFHALRDYVPGDDRRNVHWRTTARTGRLMVRQFEETHRASLLVLLDTLPDDYETDEDFETAVSVACSLALNAISDGREVSLLTQAGPLPTVTGMRLLDASCLLQETPDAYGCDELARQATTRHPEASVLVLVTGQRCDDAVLGRVRTTTPVDTVAIALRCGARPLGRHAVGTLSAFDLDRLEALPMVMRRAA
ncbi:Uncharacterized conserved protein, DUF58 family, contains vWF domain [Actinomyces ruminicola]|uniref:Uncharacterized conserved protein, DUF58 family, contains vWF domain n=1 Tax=Actinomyces ruminicola TaxID=332524 RepID=A0A1H0EXW0_9ACTO|nr:DUF58 domain-containing protein [Actinomyces ruminicola]SDN87191.1 Uncharacterized conserved protein, DUF58 family, contains vWF domain [Actinomyces ruminicola]